MSSGACRALVSLLLSIVATAVMVLPVAANTEELEETSTVTYTVVPSTGVIDVTMGFTLKTGNAPFGPKEWGPIMVERRARPDVGGGYELVNLAQDAPRLWKARWVETPPIEGGRTTDRFRLRYPIKASLDQDDAVLDETPARVDGSYFYFCAFGQDTDEGKVTVEVKDDAAWTLTQSGTQLKKVDNNRLESDSSRNPVQIFTCVEGVREDNLAKETFVGPADRQIELQAWADKAGWLPPAQDNSKPVLNAIRDFLDHDIPGDGPVVIRMAPPRDLGGYASAHDTPGVVQLDQSAGVGDPKHELAHAWFSTDTFSELWLREGMALWTASAMNEATCDPAGSNVTDLDLSAWQVVRPTSGEGWEQVIADQDAAACGIVSAVASRMSDEQWRTVIGSLLDSETKYVGSAGPEIAASPVVDYREWLDAVDERGLVPAAADPAFAANLDDLDFAQNLLDAYGIPGAGLDLAERSAARAYYHQFLADAAPLGAPLAVRKAMDDWSFQAATEALDKSYEVLDALKEADRLLPTAGLVPLIQRPFESASNVKEIEAVRTDALDLLERASELVEPLGELQQVVPSGWDFFPATIDSAIDERRFEDAMAAITPAIEIAKQITAADEALPSAGIVESFGARYRAAATQSELEDLVGEAAAIRREAEATGRALGLLGDEVGEWQIPTAVTDPVEAGQITAGRAIIEDARAVVAAARAADIALPQAQLSADIRPRFEAVTTPAQMASLRTQAETRSAEAQAVGNALNLLSDRVPDWHIPEVVTKPVEDRDFAAAALSAAAAQKWIEQAWQADQAWTDFGALDRIKADFENAQSLEELQDGAATAEKWANAASYIGLAEAAVKSDRDLLTDFGLWGVDVDTPLQEARDAGLATNVEVAINKSREVIDLIDAGSSSGSLRLAGIVFFGIAVLGVLGLWVILRRQSGPSWARQSKPHWIEKRSSSRGPKKDNKKAK